MDTNTIIQMIVTIVCSILASSGFWAYLQSHANKNSAEKELLIGLAHDRIIYLGMKYIERGWITQDEYEDLNKYLYKPYKKEWWEWIGRKSNERSRQITVTSSGNLTIKKEVL